MSEWEVYLEKPNKNISVGLFSNKREAKDEVKYRYDLCKNMRVNTDLRYKIRKVN
tara:strand:+ start:103 stop:267 length:165 start_codon:yes stop_codon:yes gene_type:complete